MAAKLEQLLREIDPSRTIDRVEGRINQFLSSYNPGTTKITNREEFQQCLADFTQQARCAALNLPSHVARDSDFNFGAAMHYLEDKYGSMQTVYHIVTTGTEGGLYAILRDVARLMAEEYAQNGINARIGAFLNDLSFDEMMTSADDFS